MGRATRRSGLVLAGCAVALLLAEGLLRFIGVRPLLVNREQTLFWTFDRTLGWHHRPGQEGVFANDKPPFRTHVRINGKGLRDGECAYERSPGRSRVLVLGDSFAWGFGVEQAETFSAILQRALPDTEVINAGVSGYSTDQELLWFRREGVKYKPDLVVLSFVGNDEWMNRERRAYYIYYKPWFALEGGRLQLRGVPVPRASARTRAVYWMRRNSALVRVLLDALAEAGRKAEGGRRKDGGESPSPRPSPLKGEGAENARASGKGKGDESGCASSGPETSFALTRALIRQMAEESAAAGARFMVLANSLAWDPEADGSYAQFIEALRQDGWLVVDVDSLPGFDRRRMTISGDGHWNADGHRFVAGEIRRVIDGKSLLGEK